MNNSVINCVTIDNNDLDTLVSIVYNTLISTGSAHDSHYSKHVTMLFL